MYCIPDALYNAAMCCMLPVLCYMYFTLHVFYDASMYYVLPVLYATYSICYMYYKCIKHVTTCNICYVYYTLRVCMLQLLYAICIIYNAYCTRNKFIICAV